MISMALIRPPAIFWIAGAAGPSGCCLARPLLERPRRLEGFQATLQAAGQQLDPRRVIAGFPQVEGGRMAAAELLAVAPDTCAILAYNDLMAVGALKACAQRAAACRRLRRHGLR